MAEIVLSTANARYSHTSFGLRCLMADLGGLQDRARLLEFDLHHDPQEAAEAILAEEPRLVGLGVYVWNVGPLTEVASLIKQRRPGTPIVLGGPEVSYDTAGMEIVALADYVVAGEGERTFAELCAEILAGRRPDRKVLRSEPPALQDLALPYNLYTDEDIAHRMIYVETARGCPFECDYCISALDRKVRRFPLERLLPEFERLLQRGVRLFKFTDRTFNLDIPRCLETMDFFLERYTPGLCLHFEMVPDHFPDGLREKIRAFPAGALHLEIGIQTYDPETAERIHRKTNFAVVDGNLTFLREQTGARLHVDLIAGLPGETMDSIAWGFDRLIRLRPHELQFGILKRLRGAPITRHDAEWEMTYNPLPPYEIMSSGLIREDQMERLKRFARYWDLFYNRGNFDQSVHLVWDEEVSPFEAFIDFSDWMFERVGRAHAIPLLELTAALFAYLTEGRQRDVRHTATVMLEDYRKGGRRIDTPGFLREHLDGERI